jgi:DNA-binding MarR family transcriptional regulator
VLGVGFLLAQLGAHSAAAFAQRIASLGVTPPQVGLLRAIGAEPGRTQQALAAQFGLPPSRMVGFLDDLEANGLVERRRDPADRRVHRLHLSKTGAATLQQVAVAGAAGQQHLLRALSDAERETLSGLLARIADDQGLTSGVHPGYAHLRPM